jgi:hypothetical protein
LVAVFALVLMGAAVSLPGVTLFDRNGNPVDNGSGSIQVVGTTGSTAIPENQVAVTGYGATQYGATSVVAGTANTIKGTAGTLYEIIISWSVPSTTGECYVTLYNSASPTVGTSFVEILPINVATPGILAVDPPPTIGGKYSTAISYAITTTPTGSTACNTSASELYVEAWYV